MAHQGDTSPTPQGAHHDSKGNGYGRFFAMIGTSTVAMYG